MNEHDDNLETTRGEDKEVNLPLKDSNDDSSSNEYDKYLAELKLFHHSTAKEAIARLFQLLKLEDPLLSLDDIYDRILKDLLDIWARGTIINNMPDDLKSRERQEQGKKGRAKQIVSDKPMIEAAAGTAWIALPKEEDIADTPVDNDDWTLRSKRDPNVREPFPIPPVELDNENLRLENGRLKEQLIEQRNQIQELIKSINVTASLKATADKLTDTKVKDSLEYKTILTQLSVAQSRIEELEQLVKAEMQTNPSLGFQNASKIGPIETLHQVANRDGYEVTMAATELITFFQMSRNTKDVMYLQIKDGKVVGWESDYARNKKQQQQQQQQQQGSVKAQQ